MIREAANPIANNCQHKSEQRQEQATIDTTETLEPVEATAKHSVNILNDDIKHPLPYLVSIRIKVKLRSYTRKHCLSLALDQDLT